MTSNIKTTYFIKNNKVIGKLDTADLSDHYGKPYFETMEFYFNGSDSGTIVDEHTSNAVDSIAVHNAWVDLLCTRYHAEAVHTSFMGLPVIDNPYASLIKAYDAYREALTAYEHETLFRDLKSTVSTVDGFTMSFAD